MEEKQEEEEEGEEKGGLQQKPEVWKRRTGKEPGWGGQRRAAARRHNIQIAVSPQHPCEVGWKVATIVMPTSQTRPGHRGKRSERWPPQAEGPSPLVAPLPSRAKTACNNAVTWTQGVKMVALKK